MIQERLLPGTRAITKGTLEWRPYHGRWLVRFKHLSGSVNQRMFDNPDETQEFFLSCLEILRFEVTEAKHVREPLDG
ncbi:MAG: hypothetical protein ABSA41_12480 [Terriglobia bacterium]|jgi:hypothetical protein